MDLRDKWGLLVDDMPEMRSSMRIQLADAGLDQCDQARNVKEAVDRLRENRYDLIVCDYNLGQGADGQQLLELVRRKELLPLSTAFLMVTGETGYEQVSTAAEYAPDDYLLKPFTSELLGTRLGRILDKKAAIDPIYRHLGPQGNSEQALAACDELLEAGGRYQFDILRLKGEILASLKRFQEACELYDDVVNLRSTPWAEVGKARMLAVLGREDEAKFFLQRALEAYPNYLAAYDSLAQIVEKTDKAAAQSIIEQSIKIAPTTQRHRRMGALALDNKDFARAESAYRRAVEKDRTGFFKAHDDYVGLAKSCVEQGKPMDALTAVKEMGTSFANTPELKARQAAVECQVHTRTGNTAAAKAALERALAAQQAGGLAPAAALDVAQACFAAGETEKAKQIIQAIAEDHDENPEVIAKAQNVFASVGLHEEGAIFLEATRKRMIKLNNDAVALAKSGEIDQAIAMLAEAADRLTNNAHIALNAAMALLMKAHRAGAQDDILARARAYIVRGRQINPEHPRLKELVALYAKVAPDGTPALEDE